MLLVEPALSFDGGFSESQGEIIIDLVVIDNTFVPVLDFGVLC